MVCDQSNTFSRDGKIKSVSDVIFESNVYDEQNKELPILEPSSTNDDNNVLDHEYFLPGIVVISKVITLSPFHKTWNVRRRMLQNYLFSTFLTIKNLFTN